MVKYYDRSGIRREARLPRETVSAPDDRPGAERAAKKWIKAYSSASVRALSVSVLESPPPVDAPFVVDLSTKWLALRKEKYDARTISYAALKQDKGMWENHLTDRLVGVRMDAFDHTRIRKLLSDHRKADYGVVSVRNLWSVLKTFLDDVDAEGWWPIARNPARHKSVVDDLPGLPKIVKPTLSIEVVEQLLRCPGVEVHRKVRYVLAFLILPDFATGRSPDSSFRTCSEAKRRCLALTGNFALRKAAIAKDLQKPTPAFGTFLSVHWSWKQYNGGLMKGGQPMSGAKPRLPISSSRHPPGNHGAHGHRSYFELISTWQGYRLGFVVKQDLCFIERAVVSRRGLLEKVHHLI